MTAARTGGRVAVGTVVFALGCVLAGWWSALGLGFVWGVVAPAATARRSGEVAAAAALAWAGLLAWSARHGAWTDLVGLTAAVFGPPGWAMVALAVAFPAGLAWAAATLAAAARRGPLGRKDAMAPAPDPAP